MSAHLLQLDVQVVTGFPNYPTGVVADGYRVARRFDERLSDVDVRRVALYANHGESAVHRFANYASFSASATVSGLGALRSVDALWVNYSPITVAWPMWAARLRLRIPCVVHVSDLWPETLLAGGFVRPGRTFRAVEKVLHLWCNAMYAASSVVVFISPGVGAVLQERGIPAAKLHYVPMWADEHVSPQRLRHALRSEHRRMSRSSCCTPVRSAEAQGLCTLIDACALVSETSASWDGSRRSI